LTPTVFKNALRPEKGINVSHPKRQRNASYRESGFRMELGVILRVVGETIDSFRTPAISLAVLLAGALSLGATPAFAARGHVFSHSFGSAGAGNGQLSEPEALAVNEATGDVYVVDKGNNRVERFSSVGVYEDEFNGSGTLPSEGKAAGSGGLPDEVPTGRFNGPTGIAVDNDPSSPSHGDVYVIAKDIAGTPTTDEENVVDKFSATGEYLGQITAKTAGIIPYEGHYLFEELSGVSVDAHGEVWIATAIKGESRSGTEENVGIENYSNDLTNEWRGFRLLRGGSGFNAGFRNANAGLAVSASDDLYVRKIGYKEDHISQLAFVSEYDSSGNYLEGFGGDSFGDIEPYGIATGTSGASNDVYIDNASSVASFSSTGEPIERLPVPGGHGAGVAVNSSSQTLYVADSVADVVDVYPPEPPGRPSVEAGNESVFDVTSSSATLRAEVNPRSEPGEEVTSYRFEYGPCPSLSGCAGSPFESSVPLPAGQLAASYEVDDIGRHLQGLLAGTVYHVRVSAENHFGRTVGEERVFTTQTAGAFSLPDGRVWELVSPPNKYGAGLGSLEGAVQASASGDAFTYFANAPMEAQPPSNSESHDQVLSTRVPNGWQSRNIGAPHETAVGAANAVEYPFFSEDLSSALLQPAGAFVASLSPEASEQTPFLRSDFPAGDTAAICTSSCYTPLVTGAEGVENVPPGTIFGAGQARGGECVEGKCGPEILGASADASHVVLTYRFAPLIEGAPPRSLYEWAAGQLQLVSILPDGKAVSSIPLALGYKNEIVRNAISANGSRVVWSSGETQTSVPHLYLRDGEKGETVELDEVHGGSGAGPGQPRFQYASVDGSRVFFTDEQQLTSGSHAAANAPDLYECETVAGPNGLECELSDLAETSSEAASVRGLVLGGSSDGSVVYFVAEGVLSGVQPNAREETPSAGQPNLYARDDGVTSLVAVLSSGDASDWDTGSWNIRTRVSPDGRWLAFVSARSLTGYDNRDAVSGQADSEVFLYHASAGEGEGELVCASCDPSGARPRGGQRGPIEFGPGSTATPGEQWVAATLPGWTTKFYQSRFLSDSGRLFFDSTDALVSQDVNGTQDVYEYEPPGAGGCSTVASSFEEASHGCLSLISSGTSKEASAFLDASESGGDVFFMTTSELSSLDTDSGLDVYDASECGVSSVCPSPAGAPPPACEGDACQSPTVAPEDPTPGSLTFQGPGNPLPVSFAPAKAKVKAKPTKCGKRFVKKHGKCVRAKAKRAKKAATKRRGK
jgi:hypothetical protein